jgi:hypothetical protein
VICACRSRTNRLSWICSKIRPSRRLRRRWCSIKPDASRRVERPIFQVVCSTHAGSIEQIDKIIYNGKRVAGCKRLSFPARALFLRAITGTPTYCASSSMKCIPSMVASFARWSTPTIRKRSNSAPGRQRCLTAPSKETKPCHQPCPAQAPLHWLSPPCR